MVAVYRLVKDNPSGRERYEKVTSLGDLCVGCEEKGYGDREAIKMEIRGSRRNEGYYNPMAGGPTGSGASPYAMYPGPHPIINAPPRYRSSVSSIRCPRCGTRIALNPVGIDFGGPSVGGKYLRRPVSNDGTTLTTRAAARSRLAARSRSGALRFVRRNPDEKPPETKPGTLGSYMTVTAR